MKTQFIFLLSLFGISTGFLWGQTSSTVGFGCGIAGSQTEVVQQMSRNLQAKKYDEIKQSLFSKDPSSQFLAVIVLERLAEEQFVDLTDQELTTIHAIKRSSSKVSVCSGCSYWDKVSLNELLNPKQRHEITYSATHWVNATLSRR